MFKVDQDFSQYGEQRIILDFFSGCTEGFNSYCVDAGAYEGRTGRNSCGVDEFCAHNGIDGFLLRDLAGTCVLTRQVLAHGAVYEAELKLSELSRR